MYDIFMRIVWNNGRIKTNSSSKASFPVDKITLWLLLKKD